MKRMIECYPHNSDQFTPLPLEQLIYQRVIYKENFKCKNQLLLYYGKLLKISTLYEAFRWNDKNNNDNALVEGNRIMRYRIKIDMI